MEGRKSSSSFATFGAFFSTTFSFGVLLGFGACFSSNFSASLFRRFGFVTRKWRRRLKISWSLGLNTGMPCLTRIWSKSSPYLFMIAASFGIRVTDASRSTPCHPSRNWFITVWMLQVPLELSNTPAIQKECWILWRSADCCRASKTRKIPKTGSFLILPVMQPPRRSNISSSWTFMQTSVDGGSEWSLRLIVFAIRKEFPSPHCLSDSRSWDWRFPNNDAIFIHFCNDDEVSEVLQLQGFSVQLKPRGFSYIKILISLDDFDEIEEVSPQ